MVFIFRSKLLGKTLGIDGQSKEGQFPDLKESLNFFDVSVKRMIDIKLEGAIKSDIFVQIYLTICNDSLNVSENCCVGKKDYFKKQLYSLILPAAGVIGCYYFVFLVFFSRFPYLICVLTLSHLCVSLSHLCFVSIIYVLSLSISFMFCLYLIYVLSISFMFCLSHLCFVSISFMFCLYLIYVLSLSHLCFVYLIYVLSLSHLCLVYLLSLCTSI